METFLFNDDIAYSRPVSVRVRAVVLLKYVRCPMRLSPLSQLFGITCVYVVLAAKLSPQYSTGVKRATSAQHCAFDEHESRGGRIVNWFAAVRIVVEGYSLQSESVHSATLVKVLKKNLDDPFDPLAAVRKTALTLPPGTYHVTSTVSSVCYENDDLTADFDREEQMKVFERCGEAMFIRCGVAMKQKIPYLLLNVSDTSSDKLSVQKKGNLCTSFDDAFRNGFWSEGVWKPSSCSLHDEIAIRRPQTLSFIHVIGDSVARGMFKHFCQSQYANKMFTSESVTLSDIGPADEHTKVHVCCSDDATFCITFTIGWVTTKAFHPNYLKNYLKAQKIFAKIAGRTE